MTIKQISIFIENKYGKLKEILSILSQHDIKLIAATVADTSDYGILRIITNDQQKAYELLQEKQVVCTLSEVIALRIDSSVNAFSETISLFTQAGVEIKYMYCFSNNGSSMLVLCTVNLPSAYEVIRRHSLQQIRIGDL